MQDLVQPDRLDNALACLVPVHHHVGEKDDDVRPGVHADGEGLGEHDVGRCIGEAVVEQYLIGLVDLAVVLERRFHHRHPGALEGEVGDEVNRSPSEES